MGYVVFRRSVMSAVDVIRCKEEEGSIAVAILTDDDEADGDGYRANSTDE